MKKIAAAAAFALILPVTATAQQATPAAPVVSTAGPVVRANLVTNIGGLAFAAPAAVVGVLAVGVLAAAASNNDSSNGTSGTN